MSASDLCTDVVIDAPARRVWQVLTDLAAYPSWNPLVRRAEGRLEPGAQLDLVMRIGERDVRVRPRLLRVEPDRELSWKVRQLVPGVFDVERRFVLEPAGPGRTRFVQSETASGLLAPVLMPLLQRRFLNGYRRLNAALAARTAPAASASALAGLPQPASSSNTNDKGSTMRTLTLLGLGAGAGLLAWRARRNGDGRTTRKQSEWREAISSHETFVHDSIDSLGYDWARIGDRDAPGLHPRKIYVPQTTEDIVEAVNEARELGEKLIVRSKGHSSNDLVLAPGASILVTEKLTRVLDVDEDGLTATVQAGAISAQVDDLLAERGLGLPIIGDHNHITVGGFASTGGISPASHRFGMFVDNVAAITYVDWDGTVHTVTRDDRAHLYTILGGLGRYGIIATMTLRIMRVDKYGTVLENHQDHFRDFDAFVNAAAERLRDPGGALYERGVWVDFPLSGGRSLGIGQFSAYHETDQTAYAHLRDQMAYGYLHGLGYAAGRLPEKVDKGLKLLSTVGVVFSPLYATMKNVEFFTDKVLDATVGEPTRMFIVLAPLRRFEDIFRATYDLAREFRTRDDCFSFLSLYVKSIRSPYLAQDSDDDAFCELTVYAGIRNENFTRVVLEDFARRLDDLSIEHGAFRYMHTRTSRDPERERQVDPNAYWVRESGREPVTIAEQIARRTVRVPEAAGGDGTTALHDDQLTSGGST